MIAYLQLILALIIGCTGFFQIGENPLLGAAALLLCGFLILTAIDGLWRKRIDRVDDGESVR